MTNKLNGQKICITKSKKKILCPKLYKFRELKNYTDLSRIKDIIEKGFYCSNFLDFNDMNEGVYRNSQNNISITLDEKKVYKICSFSKVEALHHELMWGHYANAGMGIAIEVAVNSCDDLYKIIYTDDKDDLNKIEDILTRKSTVWEYEKECRYLSKEEKNPVNIGEVTKIYFGTPYRNLENYAEIKKKHTKLQDYLKLKKDLELYCKENNIECIDYDYTPITNPKWEILSGDCSSSNLTDD